MQGRAMGGEGEGTGGPCLFPAGVAAGRFRAGGVGVAGGYCCDRIDNRSGDKVQGMEGRRRQIVGPCEDFYCE